MNEVLSFYQSGIDKSNILSSLKLKEQQFFLVSAHREENIDSEMNFDKLVNVLNIIAERYSMPVIVSTHPRTQKRIDQIGTKFNDNVKLLKPLGFKDYNKLQICAKAVLSDSGTISEESSIMNFPALNIREAHERPESMEEGSVMMVGLNIERIIQALEVLAEQPRESNRLLIQVNDYSSPNVSEKIIRIIFSYIDYVKQNIWRQY
jgi:UDP-N-acetyl-L-fucosamine synthase